MKKFDIFKTIQLILFIAIAAVALFLILTDSRLYQLVATDPQIRTLCILLWLCMVVSFFFIFMDFSLFSTFKREYRELDFAVSSDPVSGIANRYSVDTFIEKYLDKPLPDHMGCIMFDLINIREINQKYGHVRGNQMIHDFSGILQSSSMELCFVGRNGGNKFLALFEECDNHKMETFLDQVNDKVTKHNFMEDALPILFRYGIAFEEGPEIRSITELIALSNTRIYQEMTKQDE